jgi:hypothetical protein
LPIHLLQQSKGFAARQAIARKISDIDGQDLGHARFGGQPIQGCISEIRLALAALTVSTHPSNDVAKVYTLKWVNHRAAQFYPFEHFKTLRYFEQIRCFDRESSFGGRKISENVQRIKRGTAIARAVSPAELLSGARAH